jgi:hypothetical protein
MAAAYARRPGPIASPSAAVFCESVGITVPSMPSRWRSRTPGVVLVSVLVAVGCGGDDDRAEAVERGPTPLEQYFDSLFQSPEADAEDLRRVEQLTRDCMREQGYEYVPLEVSASDLADDDDESGIGGQWELPSAEFAEQYGYGMFTRDDDATEFETPNDALLATMSDSEQAAWDEALYGRFDEATGESVTPGCSGEAMVAVYGDTGSTDEEFEALLVEIDALYARVDTDPRVAEASRIWADCMADAGYPGLSAPTDALDLVQLRFDQLAAGATFPEEAVNGDEPLILGDESVLTPADRQELRAYEIAVATADYACQEGDGRYLDVVYEVTVEVEQRFMAEHREELDRYGEALASAYRTD